MKSKFTFQIKSQKANPNEDHYRCRDEREVEEEFRLKKIFIGKFFNRLFTEAHNKSRARQFRALLIENKYLGNVEKFFIKRS